MGKTQTTFLVVWIRPKFWWMGVRDNHTNNEAQFQRSRPGTVVASAQPPFQKVQFRAKMSLSLPKPALEPPKNGQMKGNSGYSIHVARLSRAEVPSTPQCVCEPPAMCLRTARKSSLKGPKICVKLATDNPKPKKHTRSWATWLKTLFGAHLIHPQPPTFGGFHHSKFA